MEKIVICNHCGQPEYWGEMRWLSGRCVCRDCYKADCERETRKPYIWHDLDGERPTMADYQKQEEANEKI
ncbi:MAG: hypothetical protein NC541_11205 [bacterium]|nr:hypothetical protein [bacterium]